VCEYRRKLLDEINILKPEIELFDTDWYMISKHKILSEEFIKEFQCQVDWFWISKKQKFSDDFIFIFKHYINWDQYFLFQNASFVITKNFYFKSRYKKVNKLVLENLTIHQVQEIQKILDIKYMF
jgi:hypothetical protein